MRIIEAAVRIKPQRGQARAVAARVGFPPDLAARPYDMLIEASIAHEQKRFDTLTRRLDRHA